jgi:hypothetical protein
MTAPDRDRVTTAFVQLADQFLARFKSPWAKGRPLISRGAAGWIWTLINLLFLAPSKSATPESVSLMRNCD